MKAEGHDLSAVLKTWKYDEKDNVRRVETTNGREVLQVRLPLGIEQYELHGRPDGRRPQEHESWYHFFSGKAESEPWDFALAEDDFDKLRDECLLYYYRYLLFFQIQEYRFCARDTLRNLRVLDFVLRYAPKEQSSSLEQYRPYILRMHVMSRALDKVQRGGEVREAVELVDAGLQQVDELSAPEDNQVFHHERKTALKMLRQLQDQLQQMLPPEPDEELRQQLESAIESEDYEEAARLRDELADFREDFDA